MDEEISTPRKKGKCEEIVTGEREKGRRKTRKQEERKDEKLLLQGKKENVKK